MRFLLLGGAGFLGTSLTNFLLADEHNVTVLDNLSFSARPDIDHPNYSFIYGDASNDSVVSSIAASCDPDVIVWMVNFYSLTLGQPPILRQTWLTHSLTRIIPAIDGIQNKHFVLLSSDLVYKPTNKHALQETATLRWGSKNFSVMYYLTNEWYCSVLCQQSRSKFSILRLPNVFGCRQYSHPSVDPLGFMIDSIFMERDLMVTNAEQRKDYIFINDAAQLIKNILCAEKNSGEFNVSSGLNYSNKEVLQLILDIIITEKLPKVVEGREGNFILDNSRAQTTGSIKFSTLESELKNIILYRKSLLEA